MFLLSQSAPTLCSWAENFLPLQTTSCRKERRVRKIVYRERCNQSKTVTSEAKYNELPTWFKVIPVRSPFGASDGT